jgi:hypothetical protein
MAGSRTLLVGFVAAFILACTGTATAYHTRFVKQDSKV